MKTFSYLSLAIFLIAAAIGAGVDNGALQMSAKIFSLLMMPVVACSAIASVAFPARSESRA